MERPSVFWPREVELLFGTSFVEASFASGFGGCVGDELTLTSVLRAGLGTEAVEVSYEAERYRARVADIKHHATMLRRLECTLGCLSIVQPGLDGARRRGYALDWFMEPGTDQRTEIARIEQRAKIQMEPRAVAELGRRMAELAEFHQDLAQCTVVVAAPSSSDAARTLARFVARALGVDVLWCTKVDARRMQHLARDAPRTRDLPSAFRGAVGNVAVPDVPPGSRVLVVDDLYQTGGTIAEVCRCLELQGARDSSFLVAVKTAWPHRMV